MIVKVFVKEECPHCPSAKKLAEELEQNEIEVIVYNLDTVDGLTEGTILDVLSTPTIIVYDNNATWDNVIKRWDGETPDIGKILPEFEKEGIDDMVKHYVD